MKTFILRRLVDVSGISGIGMVAEGVQFKDGQVALSWFGVHHTVEISPSIETVEKIHGHGGKTIVEWDDTEEWSVARARRIDKYLAKAQQIVKAMRGPN